MINFWIQNLLNYTKNYYKMDINKNINFRCLIDRYSLVWWDLNFWKIIFAILSPSIICKVTTWQLEMALVYKGTYKILPCAYTYAHLRKWRIMSNSHGLVHSILTYTFHQTCNFFQQYFSVVDAAFPYSTTINFFSEKNSIININYYHPLFIVINLKATIWGKLYIFKPASAVIRLVQR